ncbi:MAG: hypothetical protein GQ544_09315 [Candidatus Aminicenantes bacterium]|nr:hypothetical protein [Candidatus Aminicenantes bacterium]
MIYKQSAGVLLCLILVVSLCFHSPAVSQQRRDVLASASREWSNPGILLIALGDSMTHGTRNATNNYWNTADAYLELIYQHLAAEENFFYRFYQPFLDVAGKRIQPYLTPTNLGVDGSDIFSAEGLLYWKRHGLQEGQNQVAATRLCDAFHHSQLQNNYDKVLFPISLWAGHAVSQLDALIWQLNYHPGPAWVIFWIGANDTSTATLGSGGKNPEFLPIPFEQIQSHLKPGLRYLLSFGKDQGHLSFSPYTSDNIERNLTDAADFKAQYYHLLDRLEKEVNDPHRVELMLLTLPYYPEVGYLFDASDLNFYYQRFGYVPPDIEGRVSLLTFGFIYALLKSDVSPKEIDAIFQDNLVLSTAERRHIRARINKFNRTIKDVALRQADSHLHLIDIGSFLNKNLLSKNGTVIDGIRFHRKWRLGNGFCLDGVHPSHTGHALIANKIQEHLASALGVNIKPHDLVQVNMRDPYQDQDGDGWLPGPTYAAKGLTKLLFLFRDEQEGIPGNAVIDTYESDELWNLISDILLEEIVDIPQIQAEARRLGLIE